MNRKIGFWIVLWASLVIVSGYLAFGHGPGGRDFGAWGGWGHMGGWDNGYGSEVAPGWYGHGPGMTGRGDSGYGWGAGRYGGMMGGFEIPGGAYGMMPKWPQNLTAEQAKQASQIQSEAEERYRKLAQQILDAQSRMNSLYASEKRDWTAIRSAAKTVVELQRQQFESALEIQQKIDSMLTDSQRQEMARALRGYGWQGGQ